MSKQPDVDLASCLAHSATGKQLHDSKSRPCVSVMAEVRRAALSRAWLMPQKRGFPHDRSLHEPAPQPAASGMYDVLMRSRGCKRGAAQEMPRGVARLGDCMS